MITDPIRVVTGFTGACESGQNKGYSSVGCRENKNINKWPSGVNHLFDLENDFAEIFAVIRTNHFHHSQIHSKMVSFYFLDPFFNKLLIN